MCLGQIKEETSTSLNRGHSRLLDVDLQRDKVCLVQVEKWNLTVKVRFITLFVVIFLGPMIKTTS